MEFDDEDFVAILEPVELEWTRLGDNAWEVKNTTDGKKWSLLLDQNKQVWYFPAYTAIKSNEDFERLEDAQDAIEIEEEKRMEKLLSADVMVSSEWPDQEDEMAFFNWKGGGLSEEFDMANNQSLKDIDDKWKSPGGSTWVKGKDGKWTNKGKDSKSSGTTTSYITTPLCRHDPTLAVEIDGVKYHGGSEWKVKNFTYPDNWLVVCLLGSKTPSFLSSTSDELVARLEPLTKMGNVLNIDWPDMGAPPVIKGFWTELHNYVKEKGLTHVLFYCMGGHGRTGTALSGAIIEVAGDKPNEAVDFVRKHYCKQAVESNSQIEYLLKLYYPEDEVEKILKEKGGITKSK